MSSPALNSSVVSNIGVEAAQRAPIALAVQRTCKNASDSCAMRQHKDTEDVLLDATRSDPHLAVGVHSLPPKTPCPPTTPRCATCSRARRPGRLRRRKRCSAPPGCDCDRTDSALFCLSVRTKPAMTSREQASHWNT
jgi:hypothetical protein